MRLLTVNNPKTLKGQKRGYCTAILHLAPHNISGRCVCPYSTPGCRSSCLNYAGRGGMVRKDGINYVQKARIAKTRFFFCEQERFLALLTKEIASFVKRCAKRDLVPCIRLNGTSDLPVEKWGIIQKFNSVTFYDYTKDPNRMESYLRGDLPKNYSLTFSRSEKNDAVCQRLAKNRANIAVVFDTKRGRPLPKRFYGRPVIDGDLSDLRFLDPKGVIVGLRFKHLRRDDSNHGGFIIKTS